MELISKEDALRQFKILCVEHCLCTRQQKNALCGQCLLAESIDVIDNLPVKEESEEITYEQFCEYCYKRNLVVVTKEFVIDAQKVAKPEIVRCRDCANWDRRWYTNDGNHYCPMIDKATNGDWFCADGKKENNGNSDD